VNYICTQTVYLYMNHIVIKYSLSLKYSHQLQFVVFFRLYDPSTNTEFSSYRIHRILFCARGPADSDEKLCFAFTCSHGDSADSAIFQCHVFRCELPEAVNIRP